MKKNFSPKTIIYILSILICVLLLLNVQRFYFRIDFSKDKTFSTSKVTKEILKEVKQPLQITYYLSEKMKTLYPQVKDVEDFLLLYKANNKNLSVNIVDPKNEKLEKKLEALGIYPQQMQSDKNDETSFFSVYSSIVLEYEGKSEMLPFLLSASSLEYDLDCRVQYLLDGHLRCAYIISGNGLSLENEYGYLCPWLESAGIVCYEVASDKIEELIPTLDKTNPVILLGSSKITSQQAACIENFLLKGGCALFAVSPNQGDTINDWAKIIPSKNDSILSMLNFYGIEVGKDLLLDISNARLTMQEDSENPSYKNINYPFWPIALTQYASLNHPIMNTFSSLNFYWPSPLYIYESETLHIDSLVKSTPYSWLMEKSKNEESPFEANPFGTYTSDMNPRSLGQYTLVATAEGKINPYYEAGSGNECRFLVFGDQFLPSNLVTYTSSPSNLDFFINSILWLQREDNLLSIRSKGFTDTSLFKIQNHDDFQRAKVKTIFTSIIMIPVFVLLIGLYIYIKRNSKKDMKNERQK